MEPITSDARPHLTVAATGATRDAPTGESAVALALASGDQPLLLLPLAALPLRGGLQTIDGEPLPVRVLTYNIEAGFVLLSPQRALPDEVEPIEVTASAPLTPGTEVDIWAPASLDRASVTLGGRTPGGRWLSLAHEQLPGAALLIDGRACAYTLGGTAALPLDGTLRWLGRVGTRALDVVQAELRNSLPGPLLAEIGSLLKRPTTATDVRRALDLLQRVRLRQRRPNELDATEQTARGAWQLLVRLLAESDPAAALRAAHDALAQFPDHVAILADAVVLSVDSDPQAALRLLGQLGALSAEHKDHIAETVSAGILTVAARRVGANRVQEGLGLFQQAEQVFPGRTDIHLAHAKALSRVGELAAAAAQAEVAAQLDPTHAATAAAYRAAAVAANAPANRVEIPVDPQTLSIRTKVLVGGYAVEFVVDTGATLTTVPRAIATQLGLLTPGLRKVRVETASSIVEAEMVRLPSLQIGPIRVGKVRAVVLDLPGNLAGKGLLGLNVLRRLNMRLDSQNQRLVLEKRPRRGR